MNDTLKKLSVPLNLVGMLLIYIVINILKDWLDEVLFTRFNVTSMLASNLPILIIALLVLFAVSRWREKLMSLRTVGETVEQVKIDGALLSVVLALSLWCSGSAGKLSFEQVLSLMAILTPYLGGQLRGERINRNVKALMQAGQATLEKLKASKMPQISTRAFIGVLEKQSDLTRNFNPRLLQELADSKLRSFSQDLKNQGYQAEVRLNKLREPVLYIQKVAKQVFPQRKSTP